MSAARVTAIVVTYHSRDTIDANLEALRESHEAGLLEAIVVDNASADGTAEHVRAAHPWVHLLESGANLGYGRGLNLGLREVTTPYVIFMNPDVVLGINAVEELTRFVDTNPAACIVAPAIHEAGCRWQHAGDLPTPWTILRAALGFRSRSERVFRAGDAPFRARWLCGAVLYCRTAAIRDLGGFDPRFFLYFEETDLCRRVVLQGLELWALGTAQATHIGGASARQIDNRLSPGACVSNHFYRSRFYYLKKHHGRLAATVADLGEMAILTARDLARLALGRVRREQFVARLGRDILRLPDAES